MFLLYIYEPVPNLGALFANKNVTIASVLPEN